MGGDTPVGAYLRSPLEEPGRVRRNGDDNMTGKQSTDEYSGHPGGLSESGTLTRLSVAEKRRIAEPCIKEFPHVHRDMVLEWLEGYDCDQPVAANAGVDELVDSLLDCLEEAVRSGDEPEALDHFIYGQLYPAMLRSVDIDPDEVADRFPLEAWKGVYDGQ